MERRGGRGTDWIRGRQLSSISCNLNVCEVKQLYGSTENVYQRYYVHCIHFTHNTQHVFTEYRQTNHMTRITLDIYRFYMYLAKCTGRLNYEYIDNTSISNRDRVLEGQYMPKTSSCIVCMCVYVV